ncbi:MAG: glycosyltransferase, partial [Bacteroidales bacterium]
MKVSVILPTYNEKSSINLLIREISKIISRESFVYELIIVDDNSPDGTYQIILDEFSNDPCVILVLRLNEKGLASAILHG